MFHLSLGKCWQGTEPWICFQATWTFLNEENHVTRTKGYLVLDSRRQQQVVSWSEEKPSNLAERGAAFGLLRKFIPHAQVVRPIFGREDNPSEFFALELSFNESIYLLRVSLNLPRELELLTSEGISLLRWSEKGFFSVRKQVGSGIVPANEIDESALKLFYQSLVQGTEKNPTTNLQTPLLSHSQRDARERVARRLKTLRKTVEQDRKKVADAKAVETARLHATLLKSWLHLVNEQTDHLTLSPEQTGLDGIIEIPINRDASPGENLNLAFRQARRLERSHTLGHQRLKKLNEDIETLETLLERLRSSAMNESDLTSALEAVGFAPKKELMSQTATSTSQQGGRVFVSSEGALIHLGRTAEENDRLTKAAKGNDWWLHVAGTTAGAHVIIPRRGLKTSELPEKTLREAAILALHFSDRALSKEGEVHVTQRSLLKKRKGMFAGQWQIEKSKLVMVRYSEDELKTIFTRERRYGISRERP